MNTAFDFEAAKEQVVEAVVKNHAYVHALAVQLDSYVPNAPKGWFKKSLGPQNILRVIVVEKPVPREKWAKTLAKHQDEDEFQAGIARREAVRAVGDLSRQLGVAIEYRFAVAAWADADTKKTEEQIREEVEAAIEARERNKKRSGR